MLELKANERIGSRALCELLHRTATEGKAGARWVEDAVFFEPAGFNFVHVSLIYLGGTSLLIQTGNGDDFVQHYLDAGEARDAFKELCAHYRHIEDGGK